MSSGRQLRHCSRDPAAPTVPAQHNVPLLFHWVWPLSSQHLSSDGISIRGETVHPGLCKLPSRLLGVWEGKFNYTCVHVKWKVCLLCSSPHIALCAPDCPSLFSIFHRHIPAINWLDSWCRILWAESSSSKHTTTKFSSAWGLIISPFCPTRFTYTHV